MVDCLWKTNTTREAKVGKKHMYNPSKSTTNQLSKTIKEMIPDHGEGDNVMFGDNEAVIVNVGFRYQRPKEHFVGGNRDRPIKSIYIEASPMIADVDNLVKLVLDALQLVVYKNDKQVKVLVAEKGWTTDNSEGSVTIVVSKA